MKKNLCLNFISTVLIVTSTSAQAVDILNNQSSTLGTITVTDKAESIDEQKKDEVYQRDITNMYADKETVERYKGAAPADLFQGFNGVYSGDARNSGAVDPNIRGIQGQGRIPVTVDGTEQALTTYRGYNGANNRNYLDPNLVSGITVEKGPTIASGHASGIGGVVKMRTIDTDDIVKEGEKFGVELKLETSNNSVKEHIPDYKWGQDYRVVGDGTPGDFSSVTLVKPKRKGEYFKDSAIRLAVGLKEDKYDLLAAYSYRNKGNYLAGKGGADRYKGLPPEKGMGSLRQLEPNLPFAASIYKPHTEIPNTSNEMESILLKGKLRLTDEQTLKMGYRHTNIHYGEIMPSRLEFRKFHGFVPQWPLSKVKQDTFNLDYAYNPDNPYINLKTGIWYNKTVSDTNTSGGNPRDAKGRDREWTIATSDCVTENPNPSNPHDYFIIDHQCLKEKGKDIIAKNPNTDGQYNYENAAQVNAYNTRKGFNLSNMMHLTKNLDLTLSGAFQTEHLTSNKDREKPNPNSSFEMPPRIGKRQEWDVAFNFNYRPTDWLILTAGGRYNEYWSFDEYLDQILKSGKLYATDNHSTRKVTTGISYEYDKVIPKDLWDNYAKAQDAMLNYDSFACDDIADPTEQDACYDKEWDLMDEVDAAESLIKEKMAEAGSEPEIRENGRAHFYFKQNYRSDGYSHKEDNPFYNGTLKQEKVKDPITGKMVDKYQLTQLGSHYENGKEENKLTEVKKKKGHAFSPSFSATAFVNDNARVYFRYIQYARMPSIFETTVGFSASPEASKIFKNMYLKPEKAQNIEIGYVHSFSDYFETPTKADLKLSYYHNVTKNVIDRDTNFRFVQLDKRILDGLELQARYDNGDYFGDLGIEYRLKNQVCDADMAVELDPISQRVPHCMTAGFPAGYLRTQLQPKYSISANLGGRFFDRKLELGTRWLYHSKAKNSDEMKLVEQKIQHIGMNAPMYWQPVLTVDAYAKYKYSKNVTLEFVGTNLTYRYYLDPMTRSMIPAPGRTFKLGLTASF
ncbi:MULTISPECIES: TonB-dependent receptor domain-containing protein [Pasteurellaceae]|uniref:TonB-dependent receptor n=1 Tax=Pasteurella atlantica TaxID=2827233 RepID=A0AAW8CLH5_9PAST|nr:TonB-dependent receptor [Pasteurella atlantica]MBR0573127.1 TonB-dependent receptor [Pasteurella atlantica]MDP8039016.1 TonB-dependent receptor [Pasteurella atlantica]MDP8041106.1 TonB-dependent receptor [Pasteurella atlantica]MDP8043281.1 TonB-dependent receptor [Pasteurella atlantica]MDP8045367.1 TonB-dependent receptor [Pasteurella atlantica]